MSGRTLSGTSTYGTPRSTLYSTPRPAPSPRSRYSDVMSTRSSPVLDAARLPSARYTATRTRAHLPVAGASAATGDEAPRPSTGTSAGNGSLTTMLNMTMLEEKVAKLERRLEMQEAKALVGARDMLVDATVPLQERLEEQEKRLTQQEKQVEVTCGQLSEQLARVQQAQQHLSSAHEANDGVDVRLAALAQDIRMELSTHTASTDAKLQEVQSGMQSVSRELEASVRSIIAEGSASIGERLDAEIKGLNEKFGDVCVGLDNKLTVLLYLARLVCLLQLSIMVLQLFIMRHAWYFVWSQN
jgi:hypothetical protein